MIKRILALAAVFAAALNGPALAARPSGADFERLYMNGTPDAVEAAIRGGADVNARNKDTYTPLMLASWTNKNPEVISVLLQAGADVNEKDDGNRTPLMFAVWHNENPEVVSVLLDAGADAAAKDQYGQRAIDYAADNKNLQNTEAYRRLVAAAGMAASDFRKLCERGAPDEIEAAIRAGLDVNEKNPIEETPLMRAASFNGNPEVLSVLLKASADINARNRDGQTPLMIALARRKKPEIVSVLLDAGADVTLKDKEGKRALAYAAENPNLKDTEAYRRIEAASGMNADDFGKLCEKGTPDEVEAAIRAGTDADAKDRDGIAPLARAALENRNPEVISILLRAGADANAEDENGTTPLMLAVLGDANADAVSALIKGGANVNRQDSFGMTPLTLAALFGQSPEAVIVLLEAGADAAVKNGQGRRAADDAAHNKYLRNTEAYRRLRAASDQ